ncbi:hypothetical protein FRX31_017113 [Thalictrum thalictroides]|uniref:Uncharacterized protein n=1 Tax=Thalictrum thalictroides TaxID=46969 RepID=A0A7J6W8Z7_THATH|nr:hypothetical protein FRX31_017113 [Thalictrum thalictroides]
MCTHGSKVDKEKPNDKDVSKGPLEIGNKGKGIDNNVSLQDSKASKDVVQEGNGENEGWEVPKRKHVYKTRWNSVGTPLGLQIGGSSKGEDNNKAPYERTNPKGNKENLNMEEMGRGPGPPA